MVYTPEERKAARKLARRKWALKNTDRINDRRREHRKSDADVRERDHAYYMRKIGHRKKRRVKKSPEDTAAYKLDWARRNRLRYEKKYLKKYGLTPEDFDAWMSRQNNGCAICGNPPPSKYKKRLSVDHCHDSGEVRGLLCHPCNVAIGLMKEDPKRLVAAASYLHKYAGLKLKSLIG